VAISVTPAPSFDEEQGRVAMTTTTPTMPVPSRRPRAPRTLAIIGATALIVAGSYAVSALRPATVPVARPAASGATIQGAALPTEPSGAGLPAAPGAPGAPAPEAPSTADAGGAPIGSIAQIDHSIVAWSKNLATNPRDYISATNLAVLYQGRGRLSYDLEDYQRALTASRTALRIEATYAPARAMEAVTLYTLHDFSAAYTAADALWRDDPTQLGALATRFDAELELGRIDDARSDLARLRGAGGAAVLIRTARLESVTGDPAGALRTAEQARRTAIKDEAEDLGFYDYAVGEYARLAGDVKAARIAYQAAIKERSGDLAALVGLARIDAFEGKTAAAINGLTKATEIAPQPEAMGLLGDLQQASGMAGATTSFDTVRFIEKLGDIQSTTFDRQILRFELDHGGATDALLARAQASLAARPDWTGHDTVAWALYRLGRFADAAAEIAKARALGDDDARLRYHDGAIRVAMGDASAGAAMLRSALTLGPALDPIERRDAERLLGS
jgi:tetratricopeptide (TPR) repeat protein